jgi:hypothetical protein
MRKIQLIISSLIFLTVLSSCGHKKIWVYAGSKIEVDQSQKNITVTEGTTHNEQALDFSGSSPVTLQVQSPLGKFSLEATENGLYIANLEKDTLVGSFQHIGADNGKIVYTPELLKHTVDSLQQLIEGKNISEANKNFFILPGKIGKVSSNIDARIFGPYTTVPSGFDASTVPALYKFYTIDEVREIIAKLSTIGK